VSDVDDFAHDFVRRLSQLLKDHEPCEWRQVGPCVYCSQHHVRLYQGSLPQDRRPPCSRHDWDEEIGVGFYQQCRSCGVVEWFE